MEAIQRLENKYFLTERQAELIADYIAPICEPDSFSGADGYIIQSLYYDTPDLSFYQANSKKQHRRFKPRVRFYGHQPGPEVFLELKRKEGDVVTKTRNRVPTTRWPDILESTANDDGFLQHVFLYGALPTAHVRYRRQAFFSTLDTYARVTFDRGLAAADARGRHDLVVEERDFLRFDDPFTTFMPFSPVLLELKCEQLIPSWMHELVHVFGLHQLGFSKYGGAVERLGWEPEPLE